MRKKFMNLFSRITVKYVFNENNCFFPINKKMTNLNFFKFKMNPIKIFIRNNTMWDCPKIHMLRKV